MQRIVADESALGTAEREQLGEFVTGWEPDPRQQRLRGLGISAAVLVVAVLLLVLVLSTLSDHAGLLIFLMVVCALVALGSLYRVVTNAWELLRAGRKVLLFHNGVLVRRGSDQVFRFTDTALRDRRIQHYSNGRPTSLEVQFTLRNPQHSYQLAGRVDFLTEAAAKIVEVAAPVRAAQMLQRLQAGESVDCDTITLRPRDFTAKGATLLGGDATGGTPYSEVLGMDTGGGKWTIYAGQEIKGVVGDTWDFRAFASVLAGLTGKSWAS